MLARQLLPFHSDLHSPKAHFEIIGLFSFVDWPLELREFATRLFPQYKQVDVLHVLHVLLIALDANVTTEQFTLIADFTSPCLSSYDIV